MSQALEASRAEPACTTPAVQTRVFEAQVAQLYRLAPASLVFAVVAASLVLWLLFEAIPRPLLLGWYAAGLLLNLARGMLVHLHKRATLRDARAQHWARLFWIGTLGNGILWGVCGTVLLPRDQPELAFALIAILGVIPGIAFSSLSAIRSVYLAFVLPFLLPMAAMPLSDETTTAVVIGVATVVYVVVLCVIGTRGERDFIRAQVQRFEMKTCCAKFARPKRGPSGFRGSSLWRCSHANWLSISCAWPKRRLNRPVRPRANSWPP
jgi:hypothetical protein